LRFIDGALYMGESIGLYLAVPTVALAMAVGMESPNRLGSERERRLIVAAVSLVLVLVGFILASGGDDTSAFGSTRLITPAIAPAAYVLFCAVRPLVARRRGWLAILTIILVALAARVPSAADAVRQATGATNLASVKDVLFAWQSAFRPQSLSPLSKYLREETPPSEYIAVPWAGLVPWETDLPTIDLLGLNDAHISKVHLSGRGGPDRRYDPDYVLARHPYFICENFVVRGPLDRIQHLDDAELRALGAFKEGQRRLLRHARLVAEYVVDEAAPVNGTCFRRHEDDRIIYGRED
jgi:hypothetical protein